MPSSTLAVRLPTRTSAPTAPGRGVNQIWWRVPPSFSDYWATCNFSFAKVPAGRAVMTLRFEVWPYQGATGQVVLYMCRIAVVLRGIRLSGSPVGAPVHPHRAVDQLAQRIIVHIVETFDVQAALAGLVRAQPRQHRPVPVLELSDQIDD
jgi:hypothetical protein